MSKLIDLSKLPAPDCVTPVDFAAELNNLLDLYTAGMRVQLDDHTFPRPLVSDPAYQILSTVAYRLGLQRQSINEACQATMLAYALGSDLDEIGATFGVARLDQETDARFRLRIQMAIESWTTAGSRGSYEYHILSASPQILDVYLDRPEFSRLAGAEPGQILLGVISDARLPEPLPGDVAITLLLADDADQTEINGLVMSAINADDVIPITDNPQVLAADVIEYSVEATVYCYPGPSTAPIITAAEQDLASYVAEHYRLGHDIAVSGLHQAAHQAGVQRVALNIGADILVEPWQVARCTGISVTLGGRDV